MFPVLMGREALAKTGTIAFESLPFEPFFLAWAFFFCLEGIVSNNCNNNTQSDEDTHVY